MQPIQVTPAEMILYVLYLYLHPWIPKWSEHPRMPPLPLNTNPLIGAGVPGRCVHWTRWGNLAQAPVHLYINNANPTSANRNRLSKLSHLMSLLFILGSLHRLQLFQQLFSYTYCTVPEFTDSVFAKTSPKRSFSMIENDRFGLVFAKAGSINSDNEFNTGWHPQIRFRYISKDAGIKPRTAAEFALESTKNLCRILNLILYIRVSPTTEIQHPYLIHTIACMALIYIVFNAGSHLWMGGGGGFRRHSNWN